VLIDFAFPLVATISPHTWDDAAVRKLVETYDALFDRGARFAVISHTPKGAAMPGARERKMITAWTNSPRVVKLSSQLCVGSATVLPNALARGALTAMLWVWQPSSPMKSVATPDEGFDWCWEQMRTAGLPMPGEREVVREQMLVALRDA